MILSDWKLSHGVHEGTLNTGLPHTLTPHKHNRDRWWLHIEDGAVADVVGCYRRIVIQDVSTMH